MGFDVRKDFYKILGVSRTAKQDEIKTEYRKKAQKYHPDRNPGQEDHYKTKFQEIQEAYECLGDADKRLKYDNDRFIHLHGRRPKPEEVRPSGNSQSGFGGGGWNANTGQSGKSRFGYSGADWFAGGGWNANTGQSGKSRFGYSGADWFAGGGRYANTNQSGKPRAAYTPQNTQPRRPNLGKQTNTRSTDWKPSPQPTRPNFGVKGYNPKAAGGDEPMAPNNSSYNTKRRSDDAPRETTDHGHNEEGEGEPVETSNSSSQNESSGAAATANTRMPNPSEDARHVPESHEAPKESSTGPSAAPSPAVAREQWIEAALNDIPKPPPVDFARLQDAKYFGDCMVKWGSFERKILGYLYLKQLWMESSQYDELYVELWSRVQIYWGKAWETWSQFLS